MIRIHEPKMARRVIRARELAARSIYRHRLREAAKDRRTRRTGQWNGLRRG